MRQVIGMVGGIGIALFMMYFALPMLTITKSGEASLINATDPDIALSQNLGSGFYTVLPLIPILVGAFFLISFALRRDAFE